MPLIIPDPHLSRLIGSLAVEEALLRCVNRIGRGHARPALLRWFGDASPLFAARAQSVVTAFARTLRTREMKVVTSAVEQSPTEPRPPELVEWRPITARSDIFGLEPYLALQGGEVIAVEHGRSRFSEFMRALAHRLGITAPCLATGAAAAVALAADTPARAKGSAENWAFFIEAVGVHRAS